MTTTSSARPCSSRWGARRSRSRRSRDELIDFADTTGEEIAAADQVILYYAGHGVQISGRNYLVPKDFDPDAPRLDPEEDLIAVDALLTAFKRPTNQVALFLDACRDNPFERRMVRQLASGGSRGLGIKLRERPALTRGLAEMATPSGTFIAFATEPGAVAQDGVGDHSPFAEGLLRHLDVPDRDIAWILKRARRHVLDITDGAQTPWDHSSLTRDFAISKRKRSTPPP